MKIRITSHIQYTWDKDISDVEEMTGLLPAIKLKRSRVNLWLSLLSTSTNIILTVSYRKIKFVYNLLNFHTHYSSFIFSCISPMWRRQLSFIPSSPLLTQFENCESIFSCDSSRSCFIIVRRNVTNYKPNHSTNLFGCTHAWTVLFSTLTHNNWSWRFPLSQFYRNMDLVLFFCFS